MAKRIQIKTRENNHVHFDAEHNDYTLCGLDTMGDPSLSIDVPIQTNKKVNCPSCIRIVKFCKEIHSSEY